MKKIRDLVTRWVSRVAPRQAGQPGAPRRRYLLLGIVVVAVLLAIDWSLISNAIAKYTGSAPNALPWVFTAITGIAPAIAAITTRRRAVGLAVPGGRSLPRLMIAVWAVTIMAVTAIRVISATLPVAGTVDNTFVPGQAAAVPESNLQLFIERFDPLSPDVVIAFALALGLLFTGLLGYVIAWFSHNPIAAIRGGAARIASTAQAKAADARHDQSLAEAARADAAGPEPLLRDTERWEAADASIAPLLDVVIARMDLELAARLGDPEATSHVTSVRQRASRASAHGDSNAAPEGV